MMYGTAIAEIMKADIDCQIQTMNPPKLQQILSSMTAMSLENLFKIFPIGVISQKRLIGALKTNAIRISWAILPTLSPPQIWRVTLPKVKIAEKSTRPAMTVTQKKKVSSCACSSSGTQDQFCVKNVVARLTTIKVMRRIRYGIRMHHPPAYLKYLQNDANLICTISSYSSFMIFPLSFVFASSLAVSFISSCLSSASLGSGSQSSSSSSLS